MGSDMAQQGKTMVAGDLRVSEGFAKVGEAGK